MKGAWCVRRRAWASARVRCWPTFRERLEELRHAALDALSKGSDSLARPATNDVHLIVDGRVRSTRRRRWTGRAFTRVQGRRDRRDCAAWMRLRVRMRTPQHGQASVSAPACRSCAGGDARRGRMCATGGPGAHAHGRIVEWSTRRCRPESRRAARQALARSAAAEVARLEPHPDTPTSRAGAPRSNNARDVRDGAHRVLEKDAGALVVTDGQRCGT